MDNSHDVVNKPAHYTDGKIEVIDFIEDKNLGFHLGNAVKYISRAGKKDPNKTVEDLQKAKWYLERKIKRLGGTEAVESKSMGELSDKEQILKKIGDMDESPGWKIKILNLIEKRYHSHRFEGPDILIDLYGGKQICIKDFKN